MCHFKDPKLSRARLSVRSVYVFILEIMSGEHVAKDNCECETWVRMRICSVMKATHCPLAFSHLQFFIISDLSQPDQLNVP